MFMYFGRIIKILLPVMREILNNLNPDFLYIPQKLKLVDWSSSDEKCGKLKKKKVYITRLHFTLIQRPLEEICGHTRKSSKKNRDSKGAYTFTAK